MTRHPGGQGKPGITLVIVTYNSGADIAACLKAVRKQEGAGPFETIVVDNGSADGTPGLIRSRFPWAKLVEQRNVGFGGGCNRGAREARGEILVFLNPDTLPEPGFLAALRDAVGPGRAATAQVVLKDDPRLLNTAGHRLHFTGFGFVAGFRRPRMPPGVPYGTQGVSGAAFAMRRDDFLRVGGFDGDFFLYLEDTELSWRLHRAGFAVVVAPSAVTSHDFGLDVSPWKIAHLETGRLLLLRKHLPWHLWLAYAPSLLLAEALAWSRAASFGAAGLRAKWQGLRSGWRRGVQRYPRLPRARPHRFASRAIPFGELFGRRSVAFLGGLANLLFRLNTLAWPLRRGRLKSKKADESGGRRPH